MFGVGIPAGNEVNVNRNSWASLYVVNPQRNLISVEHSATPHFSSHFASQFCISICILHILKVAHYFDCAVCSTTYRLLKYGDILRESKVDRHHFILSIFIFITFKFSTAISGLVLFLLGPESSECF